MKQSTFYYLLRRGLFGGGLNPLAAAFRDRVEADSGIVESINCVSKAINLLPQPDFGRLIFDAFNVRVTTDGGATEARNCTIDSINNLN